MLAGLCDGVSRKTLRYSRYLADIESFKWRIMCRPMSRTSGHWRITKMPTNTKNSVVNTRTLLEIRTKRCQEIALVKQ